MTNGNHIPLIHVLLLFFAVGTAMHAQPCFLLQYNGSEAGLIARDTVQAEKGAVVFKGDFEPGVYELKAGDYWQRAMVVNTPVTSLRFPVIADSLHAPKSATDLIGDEANHAFEAMNGLLMDWARQERTIQMRLTNEPALIVEPALRREKEMSLYTLFNAAFQAHQDSMQAIATQYPATYTARVLVPYYTRPAQDRWVLQPQALWGYAGSYFSDWDFAQPGFQNNPLIRQRLMEFIRLYNDVRTPESHINTVQAMMQPTLPHPEAKAWMLNFLLELYLKMGPEQVVNFLYNNYIEGCSAEGVSRSNVQRVLQLRNLKPGIDAPVFSFTDATGQQYHSGDFYREGKGVLYIFWSSACDHCKEEMPQLPALLADYGNTLKIVTISTDKTEQPWRNFLTQHQLNNPGVLHLYDGKGLDSPAAQAWFVYGTPALFYTDNNGKFQGQVHTIEALKQLLKKT